MSTNSVVAYKNDSGEVRGTYVHYDGYPSNMLPELEKKLDENGYQKLVEWIEAGIKGTGYSTVADDEPYNDGDEWLMGLEDQEYGYLINPNGSIEVTDNH